MNTGVYIRDRDVINASGAGRLSVGSAILIDVRDSVQGGLFKSHGLWNKLEFKLLVFEKLVSIKHQH